MLTRPDTKKGRGDQKSKKRGTREVPLHPDPAFNLPVDNTYKFTKKDIQRINDCWLKVNTWISQRPL
jgi:hypothetical protein